MAQIAASFDAELDTTTVSIEEFNYIRANTLTGDIDTTTAYTEEMTFIRAGTFDANELDTTKLAAHITSIIGGGFDVELDTSKITAEVNSIQAAHFVGDIDTSDVTATITKIAPASWDGYLDTSNIEADVSSILSFSFDKKIDTSNIVLTEVTRAVLGEPPYGEMKVVVNGVDVSLNGFSAIKNGTYAINCLVYWDRLSPEGTSLRFTIKRTTNPDDEPYLIRETGAGITLLKVEPYGSSGLEEYKAQIILRPADMMRLPNKATRVYYELLLEDSLNEDYLIERGSFTINPSI